jgi:hypothetical protein
MKSAYTRKYRGGSAPTREMQPAKKDSLQEQPFFSVAGTDSFFKPMAAVSRTCSDSDALDPFVKPIPCNCKDD